MLDIRFCVSLIAYCAQQIPFVFQNYMQGHVEHCPINGTIAELTVARKRP